MTVKQRAEILEALEERRDTLVALVSSLIERRPITGNEKPVQEIVATRLESSGFEVDMWEPDADNLRDHPGFFETTSYKESGYKNRPNVAATWSGAGDGRSLTFSGHVDVVPVDEDEWTYDPWNPSVAEGRLYGRGSNDMLGGVASMLFAYEVLNDLNINLSGDLTIQTTIEEEAGGVGGVLSALERGYQPDAAIITEPSGIPDIGMASAGVMYFRIRIPGKSSHAARGYEGVNAIGKAVKIYNALDALDKNRKARISYEPAFRKNPRLRGHETNLNVGIIESGDWPSTVPSDACLECRIGWPPGETREEVRAEVKQAIDNVVESDAWLSENPPELEWYGWHAAPHELDTDAEIVRIAQKRAEEITGENTTFGGGSGGNDERFYNRYYDIPCPSVGPRGDHIHGADEYVEIDSLIQTAQVLALTAVDWCGIEE